MTRADLLRELALAELADRTATVWCKQCRAFGEHTTTAYSEEGMHRCRTCGHIAPWKWGVAYGTYEPA